MKHTPHLTPERLSPRIVIASIVGLWLCYFLLISARALIADFEMQGEMLWRRGVVSLVGIGITILLWSILRHFDSRSLWVKIAVAVLISLPLSIPIAQTNQWIFADIQRKEEESFGQERGINFRRDEAGNLLIDIPVEQYRDLSGLNIGDDGSTGAATTVLIAPAPTQLDLWRQILDIALGRYFLLLAWASLYFAMLAGAQARAAQFREERFRSAAKAAELRSLRYQVNPHFLFNTLNSLSALVMTGKSDRAEQMIQTISRFYRHSLAEDSTGDVSLQDEIDLQKHYLEIESVRFPKRLQVEIDLPAELANYMVPGMILQPLIENSVKYGVSASARPIVISISAREEYERLVLTVSDNGPGMQDAQTGLGIGLANVRDRLEARFGQEASIVSGPTGKGYRTELRIPLVKHG